MKPKFRVTYEVITPESAEDGGAAESGFVMPGGWKFAATDPGPLEMTLHEAASIASPDCDCGRWLAESDARINYATGEHETRAIHPPSNITASSYARLRRTLGCR